MTEASARPDFGAGSIWSPLTGDGIRPSSLYARGVSSLYTADIEIQSIASAQTRVKSPIAHFIISLNEQESRAVSDDTLIRFAEATLDGAGYKGHAGVFAVHRDTLAMDPDGQPTGNLHCHIALSAVHSEHLRAANRKQDNLRLSKSLREQEIVFGLGQDWGLYRTRHAGLPEQFVDRTTHDDWAERNRWTAEQRVAKMAKHFVSDEGGLGSDRDRQDRLVHSIRTYLERCLERGEKPLQSDVHLIASQLTAKLAMKNGKLVARLMERAPKGSVTVHTDEFGEEHSVPAAWVDTDRAVPLDETRIAHSPLDDWKGKKTPHPMLEVYHERALYYRKFLLGITTYEAAEKEYRKVIEDDPGRVTRDIVFGQGQANFTADDIDSVLASHLTHDWADATDRIMRDDTSIRILSADTASPLMTIEQQQDMTTKFYSLLEQLVTEKDPHFSREALDEAIRRVEAKHRETNPSFAFSAQQHKALDSFEYRVAVWMGNAGTGKTVLNEVHREYAKLTSREIRGFATAQKAADVLRDSSGIQSVNQARALVQESTDGVKVMPKDARFTFDEFSMSSIESGLKILERAIASNASGVLQGDLSQLPNIAAGNTMGLATRAAANAKTLVNLTDVFRQQVGSEVEWMRLAIPKGGRAIRMANSAAFKAYLEDYMDRGHVTFHATREEEVKAIAADIVQAMRAGQRVIAPGRSFQDCLYVNREVREELGLAGKGREFEFDRGVIELAVGDRVLFRKNDRKLELRNGDTATVTAIGKDDWGHWQISTRLDNGKEVAFSPKRVRKLEWAYASTIHANQGTGAPTVIGSITRGDDARSVHVTVTRTEKVLHVHTHMKRDEILERLSSDRSLAAKDDALLFQSIVAKTGGPMTPWAVAVRQAQQFDADPLRQRHEAVMAQRRQSLQTAIMEIMAQGHKPRERDRLLRDAAEKFSPDTFVAWAAKERRALELEWQVRQHVSHVRHERSQSREVERTSHDDPKKRGIRR